VSRSVVRRKKTDDPKMPVSDVCAMFILFQGLTLIVGLQVQRHVAPSRTEIGIMLHLHNPPPQQCCYAAGAWLRT
jgi:hypothetical protein